MTRKSYGKRRGTRHKLRVGKKPSITRYLEKFEVGDRVYINILGSSKIPFPRFHGKTGTVLEKRGRGYLVQVNDMNSVKSITLRPEHIKKA